MILLPVLVSLMLSACTVNINLKKAGTEDVTNTEAKEEAHSEATLALKQMLDEDPTFYNHIDQGIDYIWFKVN